MDETTSTEYDTHVYISRTNLSLFFEALSNREIVDECIPYACVFQTVKSSNPPVCSLNSAKDNLSRHGLLRYKELERGA